MASTVLLALVTAVSFGMAVFIGFFLQIVASEFKFGPVPRMILGGSIIVFISVGVAAELNLFRFWPAMLLTYYLGTFQAGNRIAHRIGFVAPDENDPPEFFWELMNRYD